MTDKKTQDRNSDGSHCSSALSEHDWIQIEQAAGGCVSGTSDEWPALRHAIALMTGRPFVHIKSAAWLQGFCEAVMLTRNLDVPLSERLRRLQHRMVGVSMDLLDHVGTEEAKEHAEELVGAANVVWQWSKEV